MTHPDDPRLEEAVRDALRRRDPGPAPLVLRERALRVPDSSSSRPDTRRQALSAVLGLAAVVVLAVVALGVVGRPGGIGPAASTTAVVSPSAAGTLSPASPPEPTPFASASPVASTPGPADSPVAFATTQPGAGPSFDPNLEGPGITSHADDGNWLRGLLLALTLALVIVALAIRGWRRIVPAVGAAGLLTWVVVATLAPLDIGSNGFGPGLYTANADQPLGYSERVIYVFAPAGGHFSIGLSAAGGESQLPARLEAVEAPYANQVPYYGITWTAVWLDREVGGGSSGPVAPFAPIDLPSYRSLWLVGRASSCANGPAFDPRDNSSGWTGPGSTMTVQVSVLGIPRRVELPLGVSVVEPVGDQCPPSGWSASPSPAGSAGP